MRGSRTATSTSCRQRSLGSYTIVFVREMRHPRERVWDVLTDPAHLTQWSPFTPDRNIGSTGPATLKMIDGATVETFESKITRAERPTVLEYTWDEDLLRWELEAADYGTRLTLRHTMKDPTFLSKVTAGWHICLVVADRLLQRRPFGPVVGSRAKEYGWDGLNEAYTKKLDVKTSGEPLG